MRYPPPPVAAPVDPARWGTLPRHFAWVDHRLHERLRELKPLPRHPPKRWISALDGMRRKEAGSCGAQRGGGVRPRG